MKNFNLLLLFCCNFSFLHAQVDQEFDFEPLIGTEAKVFYAKNLKNHEFNLADKKGKVIMLVFWSKFCGGCNKEISDLNRIVEENTKSNFELISIIDESIEELTNNDTTQFSLRVRPSDNGFYEYNRPIYKNKQINYEIIVEGRDIRQLYGIPNSSPIILFIDENFIIRDYNRTYYIYDNYEHLSSKLSKLSTK